jgi:hypothetical protein
MLADAAHLVIDAAIFDPTLDISRSADDLTIMAGAVTNIGALTLTLTGDLTNSGTLNVTTGDINVAGDWSNSGTFTPGTGTVTFDGIGVSTISGSTTFYDLACITAGKILTFTRGTTQTVTNELTLTGLVINDTGAGALPKLTLNAGGIQIISDVQVMNNDASGGLQLVARGASTLSNAPNWALVPVPLPWIYYGNAFNVMFLPFLSPWHEIDFTTPEPRFSGCYNRKWTVYNILDLESKPVLSADENRQRFTESRLYRHSDENRFFERSTEPRFYHRSDGDRFYQRSTEPRFYDRSTESRFYRYSDENRFFERSTEPRFYHRSDGERFYQRSTEHRFFHRSDGDRFYQRSTEPRFHSTYVR